MSANRRVVATMAVATGVIVANIYYAQPLVATLAEAFGASTAAIGVLLTVIQLGYAAGLATLVPLGDLLERRRLLIMMLAVCVLGLALMALAPTLAVICSAAVLVGLTSAAVQVIVPFAAHLARDGEQGRVVGTVMSGLLIGILLSRTVSGLLAEWIGWRWVFGIAAILTALVGAVLWRELPVHAPTLSMPYRRLLGSVFHLIRAEPALRFRMLYGALGMGAFSMVWSTIGFLLAHPPYRWNEAAIGLFALFGVAGAFGARFAGGLADRGHTRWAGLGFALVTASSFLALGLGGGHVVALALGVVLLDLGVQGMQITNQTVIFPLRPEARSRVNTAYMTTLFFGAAAGSALASVMYGLAGWVGVCWVGAALPVGIALAMLVDWALDSRRDKVLAAR